MLQKACWRFSTFHFYHRCRHCGCGTAGQFSTVLFGYWRTDIATNVAYFGCNLLVQKLSLLLSNQRIYNVTFSYCGIPQQCHNIREALYHDANIKVKFNFEVWLMRPVNKMRRSLHVVFLCLSKWTVSDIHIVLKFQMFHLCIKVMRREWISQLT